AAFYLREINNPNIILPEVAEPEAHVWHLFVVRSSHRDALVKHLSEHGIQTQVHYPIAPHKQQAYKEFSHLSLPLTEQLQNEVLSLPMSPYLSEQERSVVVDAVNSFEV
ncbi:aminotransferase, partial [Vibrio alginolyticus]|nr:aminotransferase [Vibrio alginolyticus]